jgi:hypothetical protein
MNQYVNPYLPGEYRILTELPFFSRCKQTELLKKHFDENPVKIQEISYPKKEKVLLSWWESREKLPYLLSISKQTTASREARRNSKQRSIYCFLLYDRQ